MESLRKFFLYFPPIYTSLFASLLLWGPKYLPRLFFLWISICIIYWISKHIMLVIKMYCICGKFCNSFLSTANNNINNNIYHMIIIPNYEEHLNTLQYTLDNLASHSLASKRYIVVLAQEEAEKNSIDKANLLISQYRKKFLEMIHTMHPFGLPGECRGKGSNVNFAVREAKKQLLDQKFQYNPEEIVITVADSDSIILESYFLEINEKYDPHNINQKNVMFVPPIIFILNSFNVPILVRVIDMAHSLFHFCNLLGFFSNLHIPFSTYGLTFSLAEKVNFWDPGPEAIGEDFHMFLKCFYSNYGDFYCIPIFSPVIITNVETKTYLGTLKARFFQSIRHMMAVYDVSFTFSHAIIKFFKIPFFQNFLIIVEIFEAHILPTILPFFFLSIHLWDNWLPFDISYKLLQSKFTEIFGMVFFCTTFLMAIAIYEYEQILWKISKNENFEKRSIFRLLEWFLLPFAAIIYFSIPAIWIAFTKFLPKNVIYITAPKPMLTIKSENWV